MEITPASSEIPRKYLIGQELNWEAPSVPVVLSVELPYWIMVPDCIQVVEVCGHRFNVEIKDDFIEQYAGMVRDSRSSCFYIGPPSLPKKAEGKVSVMERKCKTVLRIHSACNKDVLAAANLENKSSHAALLYLNSFCEAHLEVINYIIQHYRLTTYDYFAYELSPWDVPVWFIVSEREGVRIALLDYCDWDEKPVIQRGGGSQERYKLIEATELQSAMTAEPSAGEFELLDALNFMERGDYSGAIRRITTAIEAQLEFVLRQELLKRHAIAVVDIKLEASKNDFPGRLRQYLNISGRKLATGLSKELETTRKLRHSIVHRGLRISFQKRGQAQRAVDTGRWIFNWLENQPTRTSVREQRLGLRSLGRHFSLFNAEITSTGVIVHKSYI